MKSIKNIAIALCLVGVLASSAQAMTDAQKSVKSKITEEIKTAKLAYDKYKDAVYEHSRANHKWNSCSITLKNQKEWESKHPCHFFSNPYKFMQNLFFGSSSEQTEKKVDQYYEKIQQYGENKRENQEKLVEALDRLNLNAAMFPEIAIKAGSTIMTAVGCDWVKKGLLENTLKKCAQNGNSKKDCMAMIQTLYDFKEVNESYKFSKLLEKDGDF